MHIGILHCGHAPDEVAARHGDFISMFAKLFEGHGLTFTAWDVVDMDFPDSIHAAEGWLLSGSKHGAYEDHPFIPPLEAFIRDADAAKKPMVGICFGHQIIAQALGGRVVKYHGGWGLGRHAYDYAGVGQVHLNAWHQDQVITPPPRARIVASSEFCAHAGLVYGSHIMTLQPHPEISNPVLEDYIAVRGSDPRYPRDRVEKATKGLAQTGDEAFFAGELASFLKAARGAKAA